MVGMIELGHLQAKFRFLHRTRSPQNKKVLHARARPRAARATGGFQNLPRRPAERVPSALGCRAALIEGVHVRTRPRLRPRLVDEARQA